jgi:DNA-binding transcriptional regulator YdaS (Cro superfamily)
MKFADFFRNLTADQKRNMAERLGTSVAYLFQIASGHRRASTDFAQAISADSGVPLHGIRPDVWAKPKSHAA